MANALWRGRRAGLVSLVAVIGMSIVAVACAPPPSDPGAPPTTVSPLPEPPGEFSVLAYNVAGLPQGISSGNPEKNLPLISPLLNDYDVVLTQEDFDWWVPVAGILDFRNYHARLRAQAGHPWRTDVHPGPDAVGIDSASRGNLVGDGIGIMAKYPLYGEQLLPWRNCFGGILPPGAGDCLAMKGARMVRMVLGDGREVDVYSLHAEAGGTDLDQQYQVENFEDLAAWINRQSAGRAVIVGGDTNLHTDMITPNGFYGADIAIWNAFLAETGLTDLCDPASCEYTDSIDKIAYRSSGDVELTGLSYDQPVEKFQTESGEDLSDHPPVVGTFRWAVPATR